MERHVIVGSVDAMVYEDLETISKLPAFAEIWPQTARVNHVRSIYPTITYPCHTTMQTGLYPNKHGIVNNEQPIMCEKSSLWQHMRDMYRGKSIFDWAKENGLSTAAVFWPVSGNDPSIDYNIAEYWPQHGESDEQCFIDAGTSPEVVKKVLRPNLPLVKGRARQHPYCDAFVMGCACAMIREFKPNLLMVHPANVDAYRHETGLFTKKVEIGLMETGLWMQQLIQETQNAGIYDQTDFFIVSDHGQINVRRGIALNVKLAEAGLIQVGADGKIADWRAFCKSGGTSCLVYLKDPSNKKDYDETKALLDKLCAEEVYGISRVMTTEEADAEEHLSGPFSFVLETDGYTTFANDWVRPLVRPLDNQNYRFGRATHGHLPSKGPGPTLFAFGPHMKPGAVIEDAVLVDEAPTFARALGIEMTGTDGVCLNALFR